MDQPSAQGLCAPEPQGWGQEELVGHPKVIPQFMGVWNRLGWVGFFSAPPLSYDTGRSPLTAAKAIWQWGDADLSLHSQSLKYHTNLVLAPANPSGREFVPPPSLLSTFTGE